MIREERRSPELRGRIEELKAVGNRPVESHRANGELTFAAHYSSGLLDRARRLPHRHADCCNPAQPYDQNKSECSFQFGKRSPRLPNILEHDLAIRTNLIMP